MRTRRALRVWAVLGLVALATTAPVAAQTADDLFDGSQLHDVRLWINSRDLVELREHYDENTFYPADLLWRGIRVRNVAVRSRGFGSRNPVKVGLTVSFDRYTTGQRLLGLSSLVLDNLWQDPSMMREVLAMGFLRRMGHAVPREAFTRLYINDTYQGLYAIVEDIDATFVERETGEHDGTLFEYRWTFPFFGEDLGTLDAYRPIFEPRTHTHDPETALWGPIQDLFRVVNDSDDVIWREQVERFLDLEQFVTQAAVENYIAENDGLLGYAGMDNFYLYRPAHTTRHRVLPWDRDSAFLQPDFSVWQGVETNRVMRRALTEPDLRSRYTAVLRQCADVDRGERWLASQIDTIAALVAEAAHADPLKPISNDQFDTAVEELREFARTRADYVIDRVGPLESFPP